MTYHINTADELVIDGRTLGRVKPMTGRDRHPGVIFTPVSFDKETGAAIWSEPVELPEVSRWTKEIHPKVSPEMVTAILAVTDEAQWLREALATLGINQSQFGRIIDTDPRTVRLWLAGDATIYRRSLNPIARRVVEWMLDGTLDATALGARYSRR